MALHCPISSTPSSNNWACGWNRARRPSTSSSSTTPTRSPSPTNRRRWYSSVLPQPRILDVGCGIHKQPGSIGLDRNPASRADVLADLDRFPYPFADSSFDRLTAIHVIEHVNDVIRTMEEFHRLVHAGGTVRIETPHYTDFSSFCDPTRSEERTLSARRRS